LHDYKTGAKIDKCETLRICKYINVVIMLNLLDIHAFYLRAWQDASGVRPWFTVIYRLEDRNRLEQNLLHSQWHH